MVERELEQSTIDANLIDDVKYYCQGILFDPNVNEAWKEIIRTSLRETIDQYFRLKGLS